MISQPKTSIKLLQVVLLIGALTSCAEAATENKSPTMGDGMMDKGGMMCTPDMMKNMSPDMMKMMKSMSPSQKKMMMNMSSDQMKMMQDCMGSTMGMMGGKSMGSSSAKLKPAQTDDGSHEQHHPAGSN